MKEIGVLQKIFEQEITINSNTCYSSNGETLVTFKDKQKNKKFKNIPIPRLKLKEILYNTIDKKFIKFDKPFSKYKIIDELVYAYFEDGTKEEFDLLVGCDGLR